MRKPSRKIFYLAAATLLLGHEEAELEGLLLSCGGISDLGITVSSQKTYAACRGEALYSAMRKPSRKSFYSFLGDASYSAMTKPSRKAFNLSTAATPPTRP